jgi:CNT family concentrative nucleoside transporter
VEGIPSARAPSSDAAALRQAAPGPGADGAADQGAAPGDTALQEGTTADTAGAAGQSLGRGGIQEPWWERLLRGILGLSVLLGVTWLFSARREAVDWGLVAKGLSLQLVFALLVLKTDWGRGFFRVVNDVFVALIGYTNEGARFLFGKLVSPTVALPGGNGAVEIGANFAFSVLPTIIFFSSLMTLLYYLGVMQWVVRGIARLMRWTLRTSGAETLSAAGNIFVGQTEAPLLVKPFVKEMTISELNTVMTGGFATVAGGVMAAYVAMLASYFPSIAGHLLAASIMAAPAGIVVSKILMPETGEPETRDGLEADLEQRHVNAIDAAAGGAADGLRLALNVGAMLLAFLALIALGNGMIGWIATQVGLETLAQEPLQKIFGWLFAPAAWLVGVPWSDAAQVGSLFGIKMVANEFVAFQALSDLLATGGEELSRKSVVVATYALTGFANFSSIAIQIGGIGGIAPDRRQDLSKLGVRAMLGGTVATWMTATFAGVLA